MLAAILRALLRAAVYSGEVLRIEWYDMKYEAAKEVQKKKG